MLENYIIVNQSTPIFVVAHVTIRGLFHSKLKIDTKKRYVYNPKTNLQHTCGEKCTSYGIVCHMVSVCRYVGSNEQCSTL